ncbi:MULTISPECIES: orange carotenoid protein N-terminal domain-containing protein [Leptolyngbya]|uniref:Orange carotenoid protein N-terminal domain-containing protein n=1 Tax=Leptolyngbya boryana CZ1 TaxID=3060204 RepID=A0AA96WXI6_LEPBY|nr:MULTISPECIES: orange carotenoid protein N-terminal domain-containing protein [Leptolyngbya]MBN8563283.1 Orange carotenoid protein [Leptolyngbya sp. UWPOB_LEPTO1]MCY6490167.1 Orange carotenoid protein [Leptolyngbya sp. GGD]WNZ47196.1 orange carotenoid protein N-terminal domain-containing protein [Leptolyngbya boryana CZ1]
MSYVTSNTASDLVEAFQGLDADTQLALFYFIYKEMGGAVTPAAPGASTVSPAIAEGLFNQVKDLPREEQLNVQRDLIARRNTQLTREYGAVGDTTKLLFWYLLAQGMDNGTIISMPADYQLAQEAQQLLDRVKAMEFEQQITFFRNYVAPMGVDPNAVEHDSETGL